MSKFYKVTLMNQKYILDQDKNVNEVLLDYSNYNFKLLSFKNIIL